MQHLEVSSAVRHIYIYVIRRLKVNIVLPSRRRWEDIIEMDFKVVGGRGMAWIDLAQDRDRWRALANVVMSLRVP